MKSLNVYLSESGGASAICAIKSFKQIESKYSIKIRIVSSDGGYYASGRGLSDKFYVCPMASKEPELYSSWLDKVIEDEEIDIILPTGEHDLKIISKNKNNWKNTKTFVSPEDSVLLCQDKALFYKKFKDVFNLPVTIEGDLFQKPKRSAGSRNIKFIPNDSNYIIQENLPGKEYTVDVFCDENSKSMGTVVRERVVIKSGISTQSRVCNSEKQNLVKQSEMVCEHLKLVGPICIQYKQDTNGVDKILEINPRLGGTSIVSTLANVNFADLYYNLYLGNKPSYHVPDNIFVSRYWEEVVYKD